MLLVAWLVLFVYGQKYANAGAVIGWLASMWALRTIRVAPTLAAMAKGDTRTAMISNIVRAGSLLSILLAAASGSPLTWIAASAFWGELLATTVNVSRLKRRHNVPVHLSLKPAIVAMFGVGLAALSTMTGISEIHWLLALVVAALLVVTVLLIMLGVFPAFRRDMEALFRPEPLAGYVV